MSAKFTWDAENSMQMLLLVIAEADVKPSSTVWTQVADKLGHPTPSAVSQKFYKLKREYEQLKANDGAAGPSTPKTKTNAAAKTPGTGRGRKRKEPAAEDGGSTNKRAKKAAKDVPEEAPEDESEEAEAQDNVKLEIMEDGVADEVAS